jgi:thiamine pyrophosphokinase
MKTRANQTVILANGVFPRHAVPLQALQQARRIVCCDGAVVPLLRRLKRAPDVIVGDGDSIPSSMRARFADRFVLDRGQDDNDLSKAVRHCVGQGWRELTILGATGLREDHTLGNLSLLVDFARDARVEMLSDHGVFTPLLASGWLATEPGQPVSIFAFDPAVAITSQGLRYPLARLKLTRWWQATLNTATGRRMHLRFSGGPLLVFRAYLKAPGGCVSARSPRSRGC